MKLAEAQRIHHGDFGGSEAGRSDCAHRTRPRRDQEQGAGKSGGGAGPMDAAPSRPKDVEAMTVSDDSRGK